MRGILFISLFLLAGCLSFPAQTTADNCPKLRILGPPGITRPGDVMTFSVSVNNFSGPAEIKYEWTLSAGTTEKGQGTSEIEVRTTQAMDNSNVTATVKITGMPAGCSDSASETGSVSGGHPGDPIDDFGDLVRDDIKARIDNFYIRLNYSPKDEGLLFVRLDKEATRNSKLSYLNKLYQAIIFRKYDPARVTFIISEEKRDNYLPSTRLWMFPPGFDFHDPGGNPITIKGEDFKQKIKTLFLKR